MADATSLEELGRVEYWDKRYSKPDQDGEHEWFKSFAALKSFLLKHLKGVDDKPKLLHLGNGSSELPVELIKLGYTNQLCVDFSAVLIDQMRMRLATYESIKWQVADVRALHSIEAGSIDCALDKATMDAMVHGSLWDPPDDVRENISAYVNEVARVLKPDGVFLYVSFRQPHFVKSSLVREGIWNVEVDILVDADNPGGFEYFGYVMRKAGK